jgi:phosphohistidine phosphatase SixA
LAVSAIITLEQQAVNTSANPAVLNGRSAPRDIARLKKVALVAVLLLIVVAIMGFVWWPKSLMNLGHGDNMTTSGVYSQWEAGDVVLVVRHAERCDRSKHPCLGPVDGITQAGNDSAAALGKALNILGMSRTDTLTSPLSRTVQTAAAMFGKATVEQAWLLDCEHSPNIMLSNVLAHKLPHRNLILVTHSGCISKFETQLGFTHAPSSEYTSSLFVSLGSNNKPAALGFLNIEDWQSVLDKKP